MSATTFLSSLYKKRAFAITNRPLDRFQNIITNHLYQLHIPALLDTTASEQIFVWAKAADSQSSSSSTSTTIESFELDSTSQTRAAELLHSSGASLYFRSSQEMADVYVRAMSAGVGMNYGGVYAVGGGTTKTGAGDGKGEIEVFLSRKNHVTDWHFDFSKTLQHKSQ